MDVRFPPRRFEMFFFMSFFCVLLPPSDLQSIASDKNPTSVPAQTSYSVKIIPSKPQTSSQNVVLTEQSPAASAKVGQEQVLANHSQPTLALPAQTSNQRTLGDASHTSPHSPVKLLILDTCIEKDKQGDTANQTRGLSQEVDLDPGSSLILTHKISVVPASCAGSCDSEFSALRKRLEKLEMEVSTLRRKCGGPESSCPPPQRGGEENGDGCPDDCSDQGRCEKGKCVCFPGFIGPDCGTAACPPGDCGSRGRCVRGKCECDAGFSGVHCTTAPCPGNCSGKGRCVQGRCVCHPGYSGPDCKCKDGHGGTDCERDSSGSVMTTMTIETVTMTLTPENDTIKEKIHGKLAKTILSKNEEKKNPQRTLRRGEGREEMENISKTKVSSDLKPDTTESHSEVDLGLKSNTTKSYNKLDLDLKLNTTKSQPKLDLGLKSNATKSQPKLDLGVKSNTTKSQPKLDLGVKSNATKPHPKPDMFVKSNATKSQPKPDLGVKSNTTKSHAKADSDLKPGGAKDNEGFESKKNVMVKKLTIATTVHSNTSRSGQMGHKVVQAILQQPKWNIEEHQTKTRKLDSKLQKKEDDKRSKSDIKMSVDIKRDSANQTHIKSGKLIYHNVSRASAFVNHTNVELKGKGSSAKATDRTAPGKVTEKTILAVKNASKILQKTNISQGKVNRTQTTDDHAKPKHNQGDNLRKSGVVPVSDTGSSTVALGNKTALSNANAGSVKYAISSVKATVNQRMNTAASKGSEDERLKTENNINGTSAQTNSASAESETLPRLASKNIQTRNGTRPTLAGPHHLDRGPQHGRGFPKMQSQPLKEEIIMGPTGSQGSAARNASRSGQRTQEMQKDITSIQTDVPNKTRIQAEIKRNNSSITKLKEASTKISYNRTSSHTVNTGKVDIHPDPRMETNRSSSSARKGEAAFISIRVKNVTSRGFTIVWEAPQRSFKNFTLTRREYRTEMEEEDEVEENKEEEEEEEEQSEGGALPDRMNIDQSALGKGVGHTKISNNSITVHVSLKPHNDSRAKTHLRRFTQVVAGSARSLSFRNLHPQSRYSVSLYGTSLGLRSKIHRITVTTAPDSPTDLLFSDVTHSSLSVSWTKPRLAVDGFKVTYTNTDNGKADPCLCYL
uniref:EGF-like domain-containing protein n=1 Tax=Paramormyrops kingsleyae TaxID=1676925 RepID=A0A3B3SS34_9TELE